jgi:DnaJ-class molecular chaperone
MEPNDYYHILGVDPAASQARIRQAYRNLALQYHPDRNRGNPEAAARMKAVNEAYAVLSDPRKRREFDAMRQTFGSSAYGQFRQSYSERDIFHGSDINQIFEEVSRTFGFRGFEDVFREFYGSGFQSFEFRKPGAFGKAFVFSSSQKTGRSPQIPGLPFSGGLGKLIRYFLKRKLGIELPEKGADEHDVIKLSSSLAQAGGKIRYFYRKKSKELLVDIPAGITDGQQIRLRGMGAEGKGGGEPGDLYVKVRVRKPLLQRIGDFFKK